MSNIDIDTLALREAAEQATQDEWVAYILPGHNGIYPARTSEGRHCGYFIDWPGVWQWVRLSNRRMGLMKHYGMMDCGFCKKPSAAQNRWKNHLRTKGE